MKDRRSDPGVDADQSDMSTAHLARIMGEKWSGRLLLEVVIGADSTQIGNRYSDKTEGERERWCYRWTRATGPECLKVENYGLKVG